MRIPFLLLCGCISFVSLYPFNFDLPAITFDSVMAIRSWRHMISSRGDVLGNILLFVPFGFLGHMLLARGRGYGTRLALLVVGGIGFAYALQVLQIALPSRTQAISDVIWNALGMGLGIIGAIATQRRQWQPTALDHSNLAPAALLLFCSWIAYRLFPFVPTLDYQSLKNSVKPLFIDPQFSAVRAFHDMAAWMLAAYLLRHMAPARQFERTLWAIVAATILCEIIIVSNAVHISGVVGASLACAVWGLWLGRLRHPSITLAALLAVMLVLSGLEPFLLRSDMRSFNIVPFTGLLKGNIFISIAAMLEKTFLYGGFIYVLSRTGLGYGRATGLAAVLLGIIELSQTFTYGHTPEITDPILALLLGYGLAALDGKATAQETAAG